MHESNESLVNKYIRTCTYVGITYLGIYLYTNKHMTSYKFGNSGGKFK